MSSQQWPGQAADPAAELYARVQAAAAGTLYTVTPTEDGFEVAIDVRHPQWQSLLHQRQIKMVYTHRVSLDPSKRIYRITDVTRRVERTQAGWLVLSASYEMNYGRLLYSAQFGSRGGGAAGSPGQYTFSSEDGRRMITEAARALGWTQRMSGVTLAALIVALVGGLGALVAVLAAVVLPALTD